MNNDRKKLIIKAYWLKEANPKTQKCIPDSEKARFWKSVSSFVFLPCERHLLKEVKLYSRL